MDYGPSVEAGCEGSWDNCEEESPPNVVKKNGSYFFTKGARHRATGVATTQDAIRLTKYGGNPIMTHAPFNGEEGVIRGVTLDTNGDFVMYYGATIGQEIKSMMMGVLLSLKMDTISDIDIRMVLDHRPPVARFLSTVFQRPQSALHGYGDEIFPVAGFQHKGTW